MMNYEDMEDAALVRLAATQVMKYTWWECMEGDYEGSYPMACDWSDGLFSYLDIYEDSSDSTPSDTWNPITRDSDAFKMVEAINPTDFSLEKSGDNWTADFGGPWNATHTDRRRAIVTAALKATEAHT